MLDCLSALEENNGRIGRDERAKSKDERLGNLRSLRSLENLGRLGKTD